MAGSAAAEQPIERAPDLVGQGRIGPSRRARLGRADRDQGGLRLPDQAAVEALDLAEPPDQVHAAAPAAAFQVGRPVRGFLAGRAYEHQLVTRHPTAPGTLAVGW